MATLKEAPVTSLEDMEGFIVQDARGRPVGEVECSLYGTSPDDPDAVAVRSGRFFHHHFMVPAAAITSVDGRKHVISLRLERQKLQRFF
jgi:uncharacterized protein YrrD